MHISNNAKTLKRIGIGQTQRQQKMVLSPFFLNYNSTSFPSFVSNRYATTASNVETRVRFLFKSPLKSCAIQQVFVGELFSDLQ